MFNISLEDLKNFFSPEGQQVLVDFIREAREQRGKKWIDELKAEYPNITGIFDLVCNHTEAEAIGKLKKQYPFLRIGLADKQLINLHRKLKFEIERKR